MQRCEGDIYEKLEYLENYLLKKDSFAEDQQTKLKKQLVYFKSEIKKRWLCAYRRGETFLKQNKNWLQECFEIPVVISRPGRPTKPFNELSERSKRRKTQSIREHLHTDELQFSTQMKLKESGMTTASKVLNEITESPGRALKYRKA